MDFVKGKGIRKMVEKVVRINVYFRNMMYGVVNLFIFILFYCYCLLCCMVGGCWCRVVKFVIYVGWCLCDNLDKVNFFNFLDE